jgi:hypothetical protein
VSDTPEEPAPAHPRNPHRFWLPPGRAHEPRNTAGKLPQPGQIIALVATRQARGNSC